VSEVALRGSIPLLRPEKVGDPETEAALDAAAPDLGVVVAFGQFIPKRIRELPRLGYCINGHASLLPRWRGAAPIARAILAGDTTTGVSVMRVEKEMDAGAVALQRSLDIDPDETAGELTTRVAALTAELVAEAVDAIAAGRITWTEQDASGATEAPKLEREDARLDWSERASALRDRVRAMAPGPGAFTTLDGEPIRILACEIEEGPVDAVPGTVRNNPGLPLAVATGDGWLLPRTTQRAGGKAMDVDAFLRGRPVPDGALLGDG
jgi:methionyl-tRNA formyltransferase